MSKAKKPPRAECYLLYQIWDTEQQPLPIRIHLIGVRDHESDQNRFASFEEARAEVTRRSRLQQQTGMGYGALL